MRFITLLLCAPAVFGGFAHAQWEDDWSPWETETGLGANVVMAPDADEPVLARAWLEASTNRILDNGVVWGLDGRLEIQRDHPARAGFSGTITNSAGQAVSYQGGLTGLAAGPGPEETAARAEIERAFAFVSGGYGEVRLGRDLGVAARFQEAAPSVFETLAAGRQSLDPTGLDMVTTRHDLTGPAVKLAYTTPRLLGVQAGISYAPRADVRGLDRDPARYLDETAPVNITQAWEGAINASRLLRESGVRLSGALAVSTADIETAPYASAAYDQVTSWSVGARAEFETLSVGASWLTSDNGLASDTTYQAWTAGIVKSVGRFDLGAEFGWAEDDLTGVQADAWKIGVSHDLTSTAKFALGYAENSLSLSQNNGFRGVPRKKSPEGIVIEITLSH